MKKCLYLILCLCAVLHVNAQTAQQADELFVSQQYQEALDAYQSLLKRQPKSALYLYRYARCAAELGHTETAIDYFLLAGEKYPLRNFYLAELLFEEYKFSDALVYYNKYMQAIDTDNERYTYIQRQIERAKTAERYLKRVEDIQLIDSVRLPKTDFLAAYNLSEEVGKLAEDSGLVSHTNQRGERMIKAVKKDSITNLVSCQKLLDTFSDCDTLQAGINKEGNENYPFLMPDGITLYFASDREEGLGGYDIYITRYNSATDSFLTPENIGMPFNSTANDYMLAIDEARGIGCFVTDRRCSEDSVMKYTFVINSVTKVLRNEDEDYIRAAAQLKTFRKANKRQEPIAAVKPKQEEKNTIQQSAIFFILKDSIAYRSLQEFRSIDARTMYEECMELEQKQQSERNELAQLREQYQAATTAEKAALKLQIEKLEQQCRGHKQAMTAALNKVRQIEIKTY